MQCSRRFALAHSLHSTALIKKNKYPFLEFVVGFTEGDGSFTVNSRGTPVFVITQSTSDLQVLEHIQRVLGFGRLIKQGARTSRFVVEDVASLTLLIAVFNGNLVFPLKQASFALFLEAFNKRSQVVEYKPRLVSPTLHDAWLSGFTDAEGCFNCSLLGNSTAYRFRYQVAQKGENNPYSYYYTYWRSSSSSF